MKANSSITTVMLVRHTRFQCGVVQRSIVNCLMAESSRATVQTIVSNLSRTHGERAIFHALERLRMRNIIMFCG